MPVSNIAGVRCYCKGELTLLACTIATLRTSDCMFNVTTNYSEGLATVNDKLLSHTA